MSSTEQELAVETRVLSILLSLVESEPGLIAANGYFAFASSAGAIYAGATDDIISENTGVAPTTAYAREKLRQEELVRTFALVNSRVTALLSRISTLYGPGQAKGNSKAFSSNLPAAYCVINLYKFTCRSIRFAITSSLTMQPL